MQISSMVLVRDVKISQLGRKNLAVRFDTYQIGGGPQNPRRRSRGDQRDPARRVGSISDMERHKGFEHDFKIEVSIVEPVTQQSLPSTSP
jgi:hypothetical protein